MERKFCDKENVTGFPELKFYQNGFGVDRDEGVKFVGDRDLVTLEMFLRESLDMEEENKEDIFEEDENLQIEDGIYILNNLTFNEIIESGMVRIKLESVVKLFLSLHR